MFFSLHHQGSGTKLKACCHVMLSSSCQVEVELKSFLSYMPVGVFTQPQLKRELKRCAELGKPWPLVLAVIPHSSDRRKSSASLASFTKAIAS